MIAVSGWPSSSSWLRITPIRPSIMSEGATTSAPASACEIAVLASSSTVMSLSTWPSRTNPQWPWEVYSQRHTSVITVRSGCASFSARTAICTTPSSSNAPEPVSSFVPGIPNRITASIPTAASSEASATSSLIEKRSIPGIDSTGSRTFSLETTNSGWTRWRGDNSVSRTRSRSAFVRRSRRIRVAGKLTARILGRSRKRPPERETSARRRLVIDRGPLLTYYAVRVRTGSRRAQERKTGMGIGDQALLGLRFDMEQDLLCTAGGDGYFKSLNASWERVLGWSREELMSRPYVEFVHPDDVERTAAEAGRISEIDRELVAFDNRFVTKDGGYRWLRWTARTDGETWFSVAFDITPHKHAEDELRAAIDQDRLLAYSQPIIDQRSGTVVQE